MLWFEKAENWMRSKLDKRSVVTADAIVPYEGLLDELTRQQREALDKDNSQPASFRVMLEMSRLRHAGRKETLSVLELGASLRHDINERLSVAQAFEYEWTLEIADGPPAEGLYQIERIEPKHTRKFQRTEHTEVKLSTPSCSLKALAGPAAGKTLTFHKPVITIGRSKEQDFSLLDESASRLHAYLRRENDVYVLYDADSLNGTYLNGEQITRARIASGDTIRMGQSILVFNEAVES